MWPSNYVHVWLRLERGKLVEGEKNDEELRILGNKNVVTLHFLFSTSEKRQSLKPCVLKCNRSEIIIVKTLGEIFW